MTECCRTLPKIRNHSSETNGGTLTESCPKPYVEQGDYSSETNGDK
jgi:hypothetical protein